MPNQPGGHKTGMQCILKEIKILATEEAIDAVRRKTCACEWTAVRLKQKKRRDKRLRISGHHQNHDRLVIVDLAS